MILNFQRCLPNTSSYRILLTIEVFLKVRVMEAGSTELHDRLLKQYHEQIEFRPIPQATSCL